MTAAAARQKLAALDQRWREIAPLTFIGVLSDGDGWKRMPKLLGECSRLARAIDRLRAAHPELLRRLEARFRKAHPKARAATERIHAKLQCDSETDLPAPTGMNIAPLECAASQFIANQRCIPSRTPT
jgi:hypothetical protein